MNCSLKKRLLCSVMSVITLLICAAFTPNKEVSTSAQSMLLLENSSNRVLYEFNADKKLPMASTTKIVTAITVIENCSDLNRLVKVPKCAVGTEGSSIYLQENEELKVIDLLYGLMLQSGNDCAVSLAVTVGGNVKEFAKMMNATAAKAGAEHSNFMNPHGLHHEAHYTTARDLAKIASYAMKNSVFEKIVSTKRYTMPWKDRNYDRVVLNKNKIISTFDGGDGIKTGFTKKAGRCLVSSATRNGMRVICVVLNCGPMFEDCSALMEKAFQEYRLVKVLGKDELFQAEISEGQRSFVELAVKNDLYYPLKDGEQQLLKKEADIINDSLAPLEKDTPLGKIKISLANRLLFEEKLFTIKGVDTLGFAQRLKQLIDAWS